MNTFFTGMSYACQGIKDLLHPKIRHYVYIPLLINFFIFGLLLYFGVKYITKWDFLSSYTLPSWLSWLSEAMVFIEWILRAILYMALLVILAFLSSLGANFIASPFNGLLSEAFSKILGHTTPLQIPFFKMVMISLLREGRKFLYYLPRATIVGIVCVILHFIPIFTILVPFIFFGFSAWMMAVQYLDYPADNHQIAFKTLLEKLKQHKIACLCFGFTIAFASALPFVNFIIMPAAVLGATRLWHRITRR